MCISLSNLISVYLFHQMLSTIFRRNTFAAQKVTDCDFKMLQKLFLLIFLIIYHLKDEIYVKL